MTSLTGKSKKIIILSLSLTGLFIIASILIFVLWPDDSLRTSTPLLFVLLILFAVVASGFTVIFLIARRKNASYLKDEYFEVYESITAALENSTLSIFEKREVSLDISDLLFQAQENKRPVNSVIENNDIKGFVKNIKSSYGYRNTILFNLLSGMQNFVFVLFIIQLAIFLIRDTEPFFDTTLGLSILPGMFLLSFIVLPLLRYFLSHQKILLSVVSVSGFMVIAFSLNILLKNFGTDLKWVQIYFQNEIAFISSWKMVIIFTLIMIICWFLKWIIRNKSLKKVGI